MKNLIFFGLCLMTLMVGCSKKEEEASEDFIITGYEVEYLCKEYGIFPKDIANITYISFIADSTTYKLAGGRMGDDKSWFAKFSPDGTELYSYSSTFDIASTGYVYGTFPFMEYIDDNKLFLSTWFEGNGSITASSLSVLDFTTGKELAILPVISSRTFVYNIYRSNGVYYVLDEGCNYLSCLNNNGGLEWYRETINKEKESGLGFYKNYQALDNKLMLFFSEKWANGYRDVVKIIDLKAYELKLEILCSDIPFTGDLSGEKEVSYKFHKAEKQNDNIILYFGEYLTTTVVDVVDDPITGDHYEEKETKTELKNEYYYVIAYPSGDVLGKYKK